MRKPAQKTVKPDINQPEMNSPQWLRTFNGFQRYSDQEASEVLQALNILSGLLFDANFNHSLSNITDRNLSYKAA